MNLPGYKGPIFGKKRAEKHEIHFTEQQLLQARATMTEFSKGGYGCASQGTLHL